MMDSTRLTLPRLHRRILIGTKRKYTTQISNLSQYSEEQAQEQAQEHVTLRQAITQLSNANSKKCTYGGLSSAFRQYRNIY